MTFEEAQKAVKGLSKKPGNDDLLELYALYKQGSSGDVAGKRPGMLDMVGRAKYDAWKKRAGTSKDDAQASYVAKVEALIKADG